MPQLCPWCGSSDFSTEKQRDYLGVPYGPTVTFMTVTNTCARCHEAGDFANVNDAALSEAREQAVKASVPLMLEQLGNNGSSMAYIERSLGLPARTLARWKADGTSAGPVALLRMVTTFPWLLEVADNGYDPDLAATILVREASDALAYQLKRQRINCAVTTSTGRNSATVKFQFSKEHELAAPSASAVEVRQLPTGPFDARS
ncbi:MAG: hypothetical protein ABSC94_30540 [Polyangiaceae bacterium]|jgi:hypothetical protein